MLIDRRTITQLAPEGRLRVALNLSNVLLVAMESNDPSSQEFIGVAPGIAAAIAQQLGVIPVFVPFRDAGSLADGVADNLWDVALIGADPARGASIAFTSAYAEIPVAGMVRGDSSLVTVDEVDRAGARIITVARSAFDLWLTRHVRYAELVRAESADAALDRFRNGSFDVLAGLEPRLLDDIGQIPGTRLLNGRFTAVQQSIGTSIRNQQGVDFLERFVTEARESGLVQRLISQYGVQGLSAIAAPSKIQR